MPFAELDGVTLFYTDDGPAGAGQTGGHAPLLLVHGWGADSCEWAWHLDALAASRRVIAPDLRGHGHSSVPGEGFSPRDMAGDLAALLALTGAGPVVAIGHSMGAQVVSVLAVEHPGLVAALVTIDPGYGLTGEAAAAIPRITRSLRRGDTRASAVRLDKWSYTPATPPVIRASHRMRLLAADPRVLAESFAAMFTGPGQIGVRPASDEYLARRACPVLTFWRDRARAGWERSLLSHPASEVIIWPGCGHRLHEERPGEFVLATERWLESLESLKSEVTR
jgi:pimeloyl-ACP methyl ester carboxylesterase